MTFLEAVEESRSRKGVEKTQNSNSILNPLAQSRKLDV